MVYNPATDFLALWRNLAGVASKVEMPGLDYVVAALARAGLITVSVSATAPVVSQSVTAWLKTAVPSNSAEGQLFLWDKVTTAYLPATAGLYLQLMEAVAGENGVSWWTSTGGAPLNTVGNNGDFAIRTDEPGGIYGPKAAGAWPGAPLPGSANIITSASLDNTFGTAAGSLIVRGATVWSALGAGAEDTVLTILGGAPAWDGLSVLFDVLFGAAQGSVIYRGAGAWTALGPGTNGQVFASQGPGANPLWAPRTAEFASGTVMLFQQTSAPTGWTKQTLLNDYGLRVVSGAVGSTAGSAFSTVFAQTVVGDTTLSTAQMPNHNHITSAAHASVGSWNPGGGPSPGVVTNDSATASTFVGGGAVHNHSINLTLSYVDVIIASKN